MRVRIRDGWDGAGRVGKRLGPEVFVKQSWTPVLWEGSDEPDWHKTSGLAEITTKQEKYYNLQGKEIARRDIPEQKRDFPDFVRRDGKYFQYISSNQVEVIYQEVVFARTK